MGGVLCAGGIIMPSGFFKVTAAAVAFVNVKTERRAGLGQVYKLDANYGAFGPWKKLDSPA